jgi:glycosyltransferase involved in cell wall biosynthesis
MINGKRIAVVFPAYNAEKTLEATVRELPDLVDIRILVDDHSSDRTVEIAHGLGLQSFVHNRNYGYGRNQQTCYREALAAGADVVIMVHPDYQYTPLLVTAMASMIAYDVYDIVLGSRIIGGTALRGGMPLYKYVAKRFQPGSTQPPAAGRKQRRFRFRQSDACAMCILPLPYRRSFLPDEIFRGSIFHQFPPQCSIRARSFANHSPVRTPARRNHPQPDLQRKGKDSGSWL